MKSNYNTVTTAYNKTIAEKDTYVTAKNKTKSYSAVPATLLFFYRLFKIIYRSGKNARQGRYDAGAWVNSSLDIHQAIESVGVRFEITGMENIRRAEGSVVFLSNHMSTLETMVLPMIIQPIKEVTFVVKQELMDYPYFGDILRARDPIVVGRENPRDDLMLVMNKGGEMLRSGRSIIIFPQKTRSTVFDPENFNTLGVKLAKRNKVQVVPVALITDAWGNGPVIKDFGKIDPKKIVRIRFGTPMNIESQSGAEEHKAVIDFITANLKAWDGKIFNKLKGH